MPHLHIVLTEQEDLYLKQSTGQVSGAQTKLVRALLWRFWREQGIVQQKKATDEKG